MQLEKYVPNTFVYTFKNHSNNVQNVLLTNSNTQFATATKVFMRVDSQKTVTISSLTSSSAYDFVSYTIFYKIPHRLNTNNKIRQSLIIFFIKIYLIISFI